VVNDQTSANSTVQKGQVKWFCDQRGYGFLKSDDAGGDIFAHFSEIIVNEGFKHLRKGQTVTFELYFEASKKKARHITVIQ
jgi:CspA family cold shock protein